MSARILRPLRPAALLLFLLAAVTGPSLTPAAGEGRLPYTAGPHLIDVEVSNAVWKIIPDARVRVSFRSGKIRIRSWAAGYQALTREIVAPETPAYLKVDLQLFDVPKSLTAVDFWGEPIESAYFQTDQFAFAPDTFGFFAFIPKNTWATPSAAGIALFDGRWAPIEAAVAIETLDDFYRVRVTVPRKELDITREDWNIFFDCGGEYPEEALDRWVERVRILETDADPDIACRALDLSRWLVRRSVPERWSADPDPEMPHSLRVLTTVASRFSLLHARQQR